MDKAMKSELTVEIIDKQNFTPHECAVLTDLCAGFTRKEIAEKRYRSYGSVSKHVEAIADKLNAHSAAEIVAHAVAKRMVKIYL